MRHTFSALAVAAFLAGCASASDDAANNPKLVRIFEVTGAEIVALESNPRQLVVKANGNTNTAGWTHLRLRPTGQARDGVHELEFVGAPPIGMVAQVITSVTGTYIVPPESAELRSARVIAKEGSVTATLEETPN